MSEHGRFQIRTIHKMGAEQPTLWCLDCDRKVMVIFRNEWGYVDQWKRSHLKICPAAHLDPEAGE